MVAELIQSEMKEPHFSSTSTIVAIATAIVPAQGSIGIVRLSGPDSFAIARQIFRAPGNQIWESHRILYGFIEHPEQHNTLDEALLLLMQRPRSFTREDVVEFHCHGGMIPVQQVQALCLSLGAQLAQPGEFTLRAFLNGRLDLTQAESVADLVGARSPQAAQTALAGLKGKLATPIKTLRQACLDLLAEIEARIDFADDLPPLDEVDLIQRIQRMEAEMAQILTTATQGELLRSGLQVALVGRPNVGKSSLLNAWSQTDRAIVAELPGTTRDVVESNLVVGGVPVQVLDTAGIREASDQVEQLGISRSLKVAAEADIVLFLIEASQGWTLEDQVLLDQLNHSVQILVRNKSDLVPLQPSRFSDPAAQTVPPQFCRIVETSALQKRGIADLEQAILSIVDDGQAKAANLDLAINQRQAHALKQAQTHLSETSAAIGQQLPLDFWTIDLRGAVHRLGEITGEEVIESVLDRIFSSFCIGK
jgi:tRNA modification GTPase